MNVTIEARGGGRVKVEKNIGVSDAYLYVMGMMATLSEKDVRMLMYVLREVLKEMEEEKRG